MRFAKTSLFRSTTFAFLIAVTVPVFAVPQKPTPGTSVREPSGPPERIVYVVGEVHRPGGYVLQAGEIVTILKALELSEGLNEAADKGSARIIKRRDDGSVYEIPVNLNRVIQGKASDPKLSGGDILFVPRAKNLRPRTKSPLYDPPLPFPGSNGPFAKAL
jgi:protein involved in polysaccharide export with SLBB domain